MKNKKINLIIISVISLVLALGFLIYNNASAESINRFSDGSSEKKITFDQGTDCETFWITLPSKNSVSTVNMDISGDIQQSKLDLVFLIDTSASMNAEWITVCDEVNNIINTLEKEKGVDIKTKVYGLTYKHSKDTCSDDIISNSQLINAADGISLEDRAQEAWMAGIIWASKNNSLWREDTIKVVIPISDETDDARKEELKDKAITAALNNNVFVYGLWGDSGDDDTDDYMDIISEETRGKAYEFGTGNLALTLNDAANKALSGLNLKVGGTEVWKHLEKMTNKQSVGGVESSAFVKALNNYSKQYCSSYPCNVPIEICSLKFVEGNYLIFSNLRISMTPTISGPCHDLVPCKDNCKLSDIFVMIQNIVNCLVFISTIICLLFLVIGGLLYIFSLGNPENLTKAKNTILWALGGLALVFLAWLIVNTVMQFMGVGGGFLMWNSVG